MDNHQSSYTIERHQQCSLNTLIAVDKICRQYNIPYFITNGTLLGAVRHKGFIPWDDDMDIAMLRPDYETFISVLSSHLPEPLEFVGPNTSDKYPMELGKPTISLEEFIWMSGPWMQCRTNVGSVVCIFLLIR